MRRPPPERASQFLAFDALEGFRAMIGEGFPEEGVPAGESDEEISSFLASLRPGDAVRLLLREDAGTGRIEGVCTGINLPFRMLFLSSASVPFERIIAAERVFPRG